MKPSTLKALGVATAVVAVGAVAASKLRSSQTAASGTDSRVIAALEERVNDVATVVIESGTESVTLHREGADWSVEEKDGYPANAGKIRSLILALRDARVVEQKTANKERFHKLGLDEPDAEGSTSKRVILKAGDGSEIAAALVGDQRFAKGGAQNPNVSPSQQYYVYPGGDSPAVLARGELRLEARQVGWLEQQFLDIARDRIKAARVASPGGEVIEAVRKEMEDPDLVPLDPPEGMQPKEVSGTRPLLDALARLRFDDVKKIESVDWDGSELTRAEFFTEHGLRITAESMEVPKENATLGDDGEPLPGQTTVWARFSFGVAEDGEAPMLPEEESDPGEETEETEETDGEEDPEETAGPTAAELQAEALKLTESTKDWAFALPTWKASAFRLGTEAVFEEIPEPELPPELQPVNDPNSILDDLPGTQVKDG